MRPRCSSPSTRTVTSSFRQREKTAKVAQAYETLPPSAFDVSFARFAIAPLMPALATLANQAVSSPPAQARYVARQEATRAASAQGVREQLQIANAALRSGDQERAGVAMLKVLSLDPDNAEAMKALRDIDRQKLSRIQNGRAARAGQASTSAAARSAPRPAR